jgi:hypothetical protein
LRAAHHGAHVTPVDGGQVRHLEPGISGEEAQHADHGQHGEQQAKQADAIDHQAHRHCRQQHHAHRHGHARGFLRHVLPLDLGRARADRAAPSTGSLMRQAGARLAQDLVGSGCGHDWACLADMSVPGFHHPRPLL